MLIGTVYVLVGMRADGAECFLFIYNVLFYCSSAG